MEFENESDNEICNDRELKAIMELFGNRFDLWEYFITKRK